MLGFHILVTRFLCSNAITQHRTTYRPTLKCLPSFDLLVVCLIVLMLGWLGGLLIGWLNGSLVGWLVGWFTSSYDSEVEAANSSETFVHSDESHVVIHQKALCIDNSRPQSYYT